MKNNNKSNNSEKIEITKAFKVLKSEELLSFLISKLNTSRNNCKHLLTNKQILVNGSVVSQYNLVLAHDDEVKIAKRPVRQALAAKAPKKRARPRINIIYEDSDFIAIDKPNGLLSVEADSEHENAYEYVLQYLQAQDKRLRPFILHRIDKETSGVLVFAKNEFIYTKMKMNWNDLVVSRGYYAVVEGILPKKEDRVSIKLKENKNNIVYRTNDPDGKVRITNYQVLKEANDFSLVRCNIETGRKNQIRVTFKDMGHPICGDDKYLANKNPIKRLALHAYLLEFYHPDTKKLISIESKMPGSFLTVFNNKG